MRKYGLICVFFLRLFTITAQEVTLTQQQMEAMFLKQNLALIADQMNISIADVAIAEAKVWDNPEFSVGDINTWSTGREKQFSVELTQMISLSARRSKLANVEKVGKEIVMKEFEELLRELKYELRISISELLYLQKTIEILNHQKKFLDEVLANYQTQYEKGNIARTEVIRLQTALFTIEGEINDLQTELNALQKTLKNLLALDSSTDIIVADETALLHSPHEMNIILLIETALTSRPDLQSAKLQSEYFKKEIIYQRALVMPDVNFGIKFDRFGGVWDNFSALGVGLQIPIFNRNKGAIKTAQIQYKQSELYVEQSRNTVKNEIFESFRNYSNTYVFLDRNLTNPALSELDEIMNIYTKNLILRNISMVEYMDFMDSYRSTKEMLLKKQKELKLHFEQLQFSVGQDIK